MSVLVSSNTVVSPLWGADEAAAVPLHPNGAFLSVHLGPSPTKADDAVTSVAFHPVDETCFALGTQAGKAFGVSLQEDKLFLLANLGPGNALRCAVFCPGYLTSPIVAFGCGDSRLVFVDWQRGTVLQDLEATAHHRPLLRLVAGASTEPLFCAVSSDAVSCWEPLADADAGPGSASAPTSQTGRHGDGGAGGDGDAAAPSPQSRAAASGGSMPRYACSSSLRPTPAALAKEAARPSRGGGDTDNAGGVSATRLVNVHLLPHATLLTVATDGVLALWARRSASSDEAETHARDVAPRLLCSAAMPPVLRVRCSALCGALVAVGADAVTTDAAGSQVGPVVAFVEAHTLGGAGVVRLPTNTTPPDSRQRAVTVTQVSTLQSDCVACLLSSGIVHVVLPSTFHLVFTVHPPALASAAVRFGPRSHWSFTPSGPTFGVLWREHVLTLLHLPSARRAEAEASAAGVGRAPAHTAARHNPVKPRRGCVAEAGGAVAEPSAVVLAQSFLRPQRAAAASPSPVAHVVETPLPVVDAALAVLSECRPAAVVPGKGFPRTWANVNEVDTRSPRPSAAAAAPTPAPAGAPRLQGTGSDEDATTLPRSWSASATYCDTLSPTSCQHNLTQLHTHLIKHGVFPQAYRPAIWRFLCALPSPARTASQFAALARRPTHLAVSQLMAPFPLPPSSTRTTVESALSCLCWASPVFTLASYLPVLVYPLTMLFRDAVQSVVELVLVFFMNWGRDFFSCHPHGPAALLMALEHQLRCGDEQLCQHLDAMGAGVAVWGWELLTSFFTEVLTGAEWLQVFDHALAASPGWLFAFQVTLVRTRLRSQLLAAASVVEVRGVLRRLPSPVDSTAPAPSSMQRVLEESYRLHQSWRLAPRSTVADISAYDTLATLSANFVYRVSLAHDPVVLTEKLRELSLLQRSRDEERRAAERLETLRNTAEAAAATEAALVQQQRARVAAKYDASAATWEMHLAVERARQARDAQERELRWAALQSRTRSAEELAALHAEMNVVESQLRHDMVDRHMEQLQWRLAAHLTDEELHRLQSDADAQVERAVQRIEEDERQQAAMMQHYDPTAPLLHTADVHAETTSESDVGDEESVAASATESAHERPAAVHKTEDVKAPAAEGRVEGNASEETVRVCGDDEGEAQPSMEEHGTPAHHDTEDGGAAHGVVSPQNAPATPPPAQLQAPHPAEDAKPAAEETHIYVHSPQHKKNRRHHPPLPRHVYNQSTPSDAAMTRLVSQQRFLELRDRVLLRAELYASRGGLSGDVRAEDPLRRYRPPYRRDGTTTSRSATGSSCVTSQTPSSVTSSAGRRLFDNYDPNRDRASAAKEPARRGAPPRRYASPSAATATTSAVTMTPTSASVSATPSTSTGYTKSSSYVTPSSYTSYDSYSYSTTRSGSSPSHATSQQSQVRPLHPR